MRSGRRNGLGSVRPSWLQAFAAQVERDAGALLALIAELNRQIGDLEAELTRHFGTHPDADTQRRRLPLPARNRCHPRRPGLGEFSDDVDRYTNAESRKNYAGTSPLQFRRARSGPYWLDISATGGSTMPSTGGRSAPSARVRPLARSTTNTVLPETSTTKRSAHSPTDLSGSCTGAYATAPNTTNTPLGHTAPRNNPTQLDKLELLDI